MMNIRQVYKVVKRGVSTMRIVKDLELPKPDPILGLKALYNEDKNPHKVDLIVGEYIHPVTKSTYTPPSVRNVEQILSQKIKEKLHSYQPITGKPAITKKMRSLMFGFDDTNDLHSVSSLSLGGTGSLFLSALYLKSIGYKTIYLPNPTWPNHINIMTMAGLKVKRYDYFGNDTTDSDKIISFSNLTKLKLDSSDTILLHATCHNPTGIDYSKDEMYEFADYISKKSGTIPIIDFAYHGFKTSIVDEGSYMKNLVSKFTNGSLVAYSCSKNFGLYGDRIGALHIFHPRDSSGYTQKVIDGRLKQLVRTTYSNPPLYGAEIVGELLSNKEYTDQWMNDVSIMTSSIKEKRKLLYDMMATKYKKDWKCIMNASGLFTVLPLNTDQINKLRELGLYIVDIGDNMARINICAIDETNVNTISKSIASVTQ